MTKRKKRKKMDAPKLKPRQTVDGRASAGNYALDVLLKADLDGRFAIAKLQKKLESQLVDHAGGPDKLSPPITILIKKIVHKTLITQQREKLALLGETELNKHYLAMANSLRLDILALENLLSSKDRGKGSDLKDYIINTTAKEKK